jgi:hypothetical protein
MRSAVQNNEVSGAFEFYLPIGRRRQFLDPVVARVGNVDVAPGINRHSGWGVELTRG